MDWSSCSSVETARVAAKEAARSGKGGKDVLKRYRELVQQNATKNVVHHEVVDDKENQSTIITETTADSGCLPLRERNQSRPKPQCPPPRSDFSSKKNTIGEEGETGCSSPDDEDDNTSFEFLAIPSYPLSTSMQAEASVCLREGDELILCNESFSDDDVENCGEGAENSASAIGPHQQQGNGSNSANSGQRIDRGGPSMTNENEGKGVRWKDGPDGLPNDKQNVSGGDDSHTHKWVKKPDSLSPTDLEKSIPWQESSVESHPHTGYAKQAPTPSLLERSRLERSVIISDDENSIVESCSSIGTSHKSWESNGAPMTPISIIRHNSMEVSLQETKLYTEKINELSTALEEKKAEVLCQVRQRQAHEDELKRLRTQHHRAQNELLRLHAKQGDLSDETSKQQHGGGHSQKQEQGGVRLGATASQIEMQLAEVQEKHSALKKRNETLVTEVNFAGQTCVELSEQKIALETENERLCNEIKKMKEENEQYHKAVVRAEQRSAKLEIEHDDLILQVAEQRARLETQVATLTSNLTETKSDNNALKREMDIVRRANMSLELQLEASQKSAGEVSSDFLEAKQKIEDLTNRLAVSEAKADLNVMSSVRSQSEAESELQIKLDTLQTANDALRKELTKEREQMHAVVYDRDNLERRCTELENGPAHDPQSDREESVHQSVATPEKANSFKHISQSVHTPTSQVLAKTLQSELSKGHSASDRILVLEKELAVVSHELKLTRDENKKIRSQTAALSKTIQDFETQIERSNQRKHNDDGNLSVTSSELRALTEGHYSVPEGDMEAEEVNFSAIADILDNVSFQVCEAFVAKDEAERVALEWKESAKNIESLNKSLDTDEKEELLGKLGALEAELKKYREKEEEASNRRSDECEQPARSDVGQDCANHAKEKTNDEDMMSHRISQLESELEICRHRLQKAKEELDELRTNSRLADEVKKEADAELQRLRFDAESFGVRLAKVEGEAARYRQTAGDLQEALKRAENDASMQKGKSEKLRLEAERLQMRIEDLEGQLKEGQAACANVEGQLSITREQLSSSDKESKRLSSSIQQAEAVRLDLEAALRDSEAKHEKDADAHAQQLDTIRNDLRVALRKIAELENEADCLKKNLELEREASKQSQQHSIELKNQIELFKATRSQDKGIMDDLRHELNQAMADVRNQKELISSSENVVKEVEDERTRSNAAINGLRSTLAETEKDLVEKTEELVALQNRIDLATTTQIASEETALNAKHEVLVRDKALTEKERALKEVTEERDALSNKCAQIREANVALHEAIASTRTELENANAMLTGKTDELKSMQQERDALSNKCRHLSEQVASLSSELQESVAARSELVTAKEKLSGKDRALNVLQTEQVDLSNKYNELCEKNASLVTQLRETVALTRSELVATQNGHDASMRSMHEELRTSQSQFEACREEINILQQKHVELVGSLNEANVEAIRSEQHRKEQEKIISQLRLRLQEANNMKEVQDVLTREERIHENTRLKLDQASSEILRLKEDCTRKQEQLASKTKEASELHVKIESLDQRCMRLKDYISKLTEKCERWAASYEGKESELINTQNELRHAQQELSAAVKVDSTSTGSRSSSFNCPDCKYLRRIYMKEGDKLRKEISERYLEIEALRSKLGKAEATINSLTETVRLGTSYASIQDVHLDPPVSHVHIRGGVASTTTWQQPESRKTSPTVGNPVIAASVASGNRSSDDEYGTV